MGPSGRITHVMRYILDIFDILNCLGQVYVGIVFG